MQVEETTRIVLPSGFNVGMSKNIYYDHYLEFTESQYFSFNNFINAGTYFPQIMQFIVVLTAILNGRTAWTEIILCNVVSGAFFSFLWFCGHFYRIPGLAFISCLIGGNIFRFFIHLIVIAIIALFVIKEWTVLLFCIIGGVISMIIKTILLGVLSNVKYTNGVVKYISAFRYKM